MIALLALSVLLGCQSADKSEQKGIFGKSRTQRDCLRVHLVDAIELNKQRKPEYALLTNGESKAISNKMIAFEQASLPVARIIDGKAARFHRLGINVICDDLIDMKETPEFLANDTTIAGKIFLDLDDKDIKSTIRTKLEGGDYAAVRDFTDGVIKDIDKRNGSNCMFKHFLESVRRSAALMVKYRKAVPDPKLWRDLVSLENRYIRLQVSSLSFAQIVDKRAAPIHRKGVGVICRDVPHIPLPDQK